MRAVNRDAPNKRAFAPTMELRFPQRPAQLHGRAVIILMFKAKCLQSGAQLSKPWVIIVTQRTGTREASLLSSLAGHHPDAPVSVPNNPSCRLRAHLPVV